MGQNPARFEDMARPVVNPSSYEKIFIRHALYFFAFDIPAIKVSCGLGQELFVVAIYRV